MGNIFKILGETKINPSPSSFPRRLVIELCECIHIHFRNMRLEYDDTEFLNFAYTMGQAAKNLVNYRMQSLERKKLPIDAINPWDDGHIKTEDGFTTGTDTQRHLHLIKFVKLLIREGGKITPILVKPIGDNKYQRLDGFCRYIAFKELGYAEIECFVNENAGPGDQYNIALVEE